MAGAATNKELATAEADRLLGLAQLPPGAARLDTAPAALPGPVSGTPGTSSLIDHPQYWRVPMSLTRAMAWFLAHAPSGLAEAGSASGSGPGTQTAGLGFGAPDSPAWRGAVLDVGVAESASTPGVSDVRLDGMAEWLDTVPVKDEAPGPRLRVSVGKPCPTSDARYVGVSNTGDDLAAALLPTGSPTAALVCAYNGLNGDTFALSHEVTLDAAAATRVAAALAATPLAHLNGVVRHCPMDDGSALVFAFRYPGRDDVDIWYHSAGCRSVSNGVIGADATEPFSPLVAAYASK